MKHEAKKTPREVVRAALDSDRSFTLRIELQDLPGAIVQDEHDCIAAHCMQRQDCVDDAYVKKSRTYVLFNHLAPVSDWIGRWVKFENPKRLFDAVNNFDGSGSGFPPGEYVLLHICPSEKRANREATLRAQRNGTNVRNPTRQAFLGSDGERLRPVRTRPAFSLR